MTPDLQYSISSVERGLPVDTHRAILERLVEIELKTSDLYTIFRNAREEDAEFWSGLALEEINHASIIKGAISSFVEEGLYPVEVPPPTLAELNQVVRRLNQLLAKFRKRPPTRASTFRIALEIEDSSGEVHYQRAVEATPQTVFLEMFQKLNAGEADHAQRIREYIGAKSL